MNTRLYVGNLPFDVTDRDLRSIFEEVGTVTSAIVISEFGSEGKSKSKGFGFVEMETEEDAKKAKLLDGKEITGSEDKDGRSGTGGSQSRAPRPMKVDWARERESGGRSSGGYRGGFGGRDRQGGGFRRERRDSGYGSGGDYGDDRY